MREESWDSASGGGRASSALDGDGEDDAIGRAPKFHTHWSKEKIQFTEEPPERSESERALNWSRFSICSVL